jgi:perosamine synthetase
MSTFSHWVIRSLDPDIIIKRHRFNYEYFQNRLKHAVELVFEHLPDGVCPLLFPFLSYDNKSTMNALRERGIEAWAWWWWTHPLLRGKSSSEVEELRHRVVVIPCHEGLSQRTIERMAKIVIDVMAH